MSVARIWIPILMAGAAAATWAQGIGMSKADANAKPETRPQTAAARPPVAKPVLIAAAAVAAPAPADKLALFKAAGFVQQHGQWRSANCDDPGTAAYSPGTIESFADVNGDGNPEAVVTESSSYCYGNTGTAFWLVSKQADGKWALMAQDTGVLRFLKTKGSGGWPDIEIGGPGFCFPIMRWNGKSYVADRNEYEGKLCRS